jgi:hypothetical protein
MAWRVFVVPKIHYAYRKNILSPYDGLLEKKKTYAWPGVVSLYLKSIMYPEKIYYRPDDGGSKDR